MAEELDTMKSELARLREKYARLVAEIERLSTTLAEALKRIEELERGRKQPPGFVKSNDAAGTLHAPFVQGSAGGPFPSRSLWYTRSTDGGEAWGERVLMAEAATAHPRIAAAGAQILVLWQDLAPGTLSLRTGRYPYAPPI